MLRGYRNLIGVSPRLAEYMRCLAPRSRVTSIPFAMDLDLYPMLDPHVGDRPPTIGLIASFNWTPGYTAGLRLVQDLWPEVKRRVPEARLHLAGVGAAKCSGITSAGLT